MANKQRKTELRICVGPPFFKMPNRFAIGFGTVFVMSFYLFRSKRKLLLTWLHF